MPEDEIEAVKELPALVDIQAAENADVKVMSVGRTHKRPCMHAGLISHIARSSSNLRTWYHGSIPIIQVQCWLDAGWSKAREVACATKAKPPITHA